MNRSKESTRRGTDGVHPPVGQLSKKSTTVVAGDPNNEHARRGPPTSSTQKVLRGNTMTSFRHQSGWMHPRYSTTSHFPTSTRKSLSLLRMSVYLASIPRSSLHRRTTMIQDTRVIGADLTDIRDGELEHSVTIGCEDRLLWLVFTVVQTDVRSPTTTHIFVMAHTLIKQDSIVPKSVVASNRSRAFTENRKQHLR